MMLARNSTMRSQAIKGLFLRQFSTNTQYIGGSTQAPKPPRQANVQSHGAKPNASQSLGEPTSILYTNVPSVATHSVPLTATSSYDIKESPLNFEASVALPKNFGAGNLLVEVEQGANALRVTGDADGVHFTQHFACGGVLDLQQLQTVFQDGRFVVQAPKIHFLNGNSKLNAFA